MNTSQEKEDALLELARIAGEIAAIKLMASGVLKTLLSEFLHFKMAETMSPQDIAAMKEATDVIKARMSDIHFKVACWKHEIHQPRDD